MPASHRFVRFAAWAYFAVALVFAATVMVGPSFLERSLSRGAIVSAVVLTAVAVGLGTWSLRIVGGRSNLNFAYFLAAMCAVTVAGVGFAGLVGAAMLGIPLVGVIWAWEKARKEATAPKETSAS